MLERKIVYKDFEGVEREEVHQFNLTESEMTMWMTTTGEYTLDKVLLRLAQEKNGRKIMETFEDLIRRSYGKKSLDGRRFEKSEEIWLNFYQTEAYSQLFMELVTDAKKASAFVKGIIPSEVSKQISEVLEDNKEGLPVELKEYIVN